MVPSSLPRPARLHIEGRAGPAHRRIEHLLEGVDEASVQEQSIDPSEFLVLSEKRWITETLTETQSRMRVAVHDG